MCIQLACSRRPRAFEEAHRRNIQDKFYNEIFCLVYDNIWDSQYEKHGATLKHNIRDSLYEGHGATLKHKCGKRDSSISPFIFFFFIFFFLLFLGLSFFSFGLSFFLPFSFFSLGQCSNNDDHHTFIDYNTWITTRN